MSAKVLVICAARSYKLKRNLAAKKVKRGGFRWDGHFTIVEIVLIPAGPSTLALSWIDGLLGVGNLLPFSKSHNPMRYPDKLHYCIPAVGAHSRPMHVSDVNEKS